MGDAEAAAAVSQTVRAEPDSDEHGDGESPRYPLAVSYCKVCTLPHEFCEYSDTRERCDEWMKANAPEEFKLLSAMRDCTVRGDTDTAGEKEDRVTNSSAEPTPDVNSTPTSNLKGILKKPRYDVDYTEKSSRKRVRWEPPNFVSVGTMPRGKKKITVVKGLAAFGVDVKKASRTFAQKFACGVSTVDDQGLVLQGDVADELIDLLKAKFKEVPSDVIRNVGTMAK